MKVADEPVSKVLDWFKRSSGTEDRKHVSAGSQGKEPKEDFSTRTAVLPTEHSGPSTDGKTEVTEELPFRKIKQQNSISPTSFISEDIQLIKERMKPKKGEENEEQNDKSLTEFDCTRLEEKERGQEIKGQNEKSNLLEHQEDKLPVQKCESEKAREEKRRIRKIRSFWERDKTIPSHGEKEVSNNTNASGGGALKGLRESDKIKPTAVYLPNGLDDQNKNTLRSAELSCASQASRNEHQNFFEFGPGHAVEKTERTLPSDGEVHEYTELPKASNLQPSVGATSASPGSKDKDEKETLKGNVAACSQQKPSFRVLSLKEKMNEKSKNQISDPSQFQSLRNFWDTRVKLQSSIDRGDVSLPNNTSSITYERKSEEDKGRDNVSKQELIQQQTQTSERGKTQKLDSVVCELPLGSPTLKGLNVTHTKNTNSVQLDRKPVISKPQEKMGLPEQEVKECEEKSVVSSKEHHVSLQLLQSSGDKDALKETAVDDWLCLPIEKVENKTTPLDINLPKEEAELDVFKLGLNKLEKEASEMSSSLNIKENILKGTTFHSNQCNVFERTVEQSHDISLADQKEEKGKSTGKVNVPSTGEHENKKSLRKLFREFEPFSLQHQAVDKDDTLEGSQRPKAGLQNLLRETFVFQPSEYRRVGMKTSDDMNSISQTNCSVESTCQEDTGQPEEVNETTEKSVAPTKVSGLSSALEKLLKEASETPPPKPKRADSTVQRTAEMEGKSTTCEPDGELLQEIGETIDKSVAPTKVSGLSSALEKLLKEASEMPPPKPKRADSTVQRTAEMEGKSTTCEPDGELLQEIGETIDKSVAPTKVSGLSSALEKLLKEASETPPPKPKRADSTVQRTAEMEGKSTTCEPDGELLQEIGETIDKSVAPTKVSGLSSVLEKLLKEASEMPPPKPKRGDSTVQRTAEMEGKSTTCEPDGELLQEIGETINKSVAPTKVSGLSSALEKLLKEASETPPPKPKRADSTVQRTAETEGKSTTCEPDGELLQEIGETIDKSVAPTKVSGLSSALEKLLKEASETPPPKPKRADSTVQRTAEMEGKSTTCEPDGELLQEIGETIDKSVAPTKVSGLSSALEKLLKEASETPPPKPKRADSTVQRTAEMEGKSTTCEPDGELLQEIGETIDKSVAPTKVSGLSSALEKLLKEASEMPPPKPKRADSTVQRTAETEGKSTTYEHDGELLQEISETIERPALSKAECGVFDLNLQELPKEVSETPASVLENMDKKMQGKIQASRSMHAPNQQERGHPQEIQETIEKTFVSNIAKFSEFSCSLEKLLQEASEVSCPISKELHKQEKFGDLMFPSQKETLFMTMSQPPNALSSCHTQMKIAIKEGAPEQNIKASVNDLAVSETEASDLPKRNGAINKVEKRNVAPVDLPSLEGETNMIAIKPFKINEKGRRDESTPLDASGKNSEFKALLKFRKASTPLKDESKSPQPEGARDCLMSQHENNDEEEGDGSNFGSKFPDENSDSHSGTGSSTRSEEELNPVLMALKRSADRKMPSKSLEDIPSATSNKGKINNPKEELALSAEDGPKPDQHQERNENAAGISTVPSQPDKLFSNPEKLKGLSKSVPSFLQEESDDRETDTASESSYSLGRIKKSPSSLTNLSGSSGMASLSSVSGSLMSIYSADFGNVDVKGNIQFAIDYVEQLNELHIFICQCKDLAVADVKRQRSDPYVKTYLLPEKYKLGKRKTSVKKKTFNPVYNEILRYKIEKGVLKNQSLNISVWHNDTFGRNSFLGEVELDLGTWDWNDKSNKQINWFPLKPRTSTMALELENRGEMKLALQYVPHPVGGKKTLSTGEVHIWVKECHDLPLLRGNRLNSFIKCTVLPDTSRKSRQKTRTVGKTTNPVFNHTMVYDGFRPEDLKEACIELTVWDHNKLANHFLGGLRIGLGTGKSYGTTVDWMDSTSDETALWEKMMNSPNTWIEDTLPLRMLMVAKLTK
ncbi:synaptotagmin-like protein 2 isoform X2 [Ciconia boyciana]|uniref:synaptotagmin-like protein 2 isoform X2 n=1 Tax=Ciconia boyciana TaxID=52775 RepID=UPI003B9F41E6